MKNKTFLLILGAPRSGTTLLTAMVGRHDEVAMLNEELHGTMRKIVSKRVVGNKLCIPNQIEMTERGGPWIRRLQRRGLLKRHPESRLSVEDYLAWKPIKLIAIVRDASSVVRSIMERGKKSDELAIYRWCRSVEVIHALQERCPDQLLVLTFEQLLSEPERMMREVARHLDLEYQSKMLEGYKFTPIYNNQGIDVTKTERRVSYDVLPEVLKRHPGTHEKYVRLVQRCTERAPGSSEGLTAGATADVSLGSSTPYVG